MPAISSEFRDGVLIVCLNESRLVEEDTIQKIGRQLQEAAVQAREGRMLLNLEDVSFMGSSMIGQLVMLIKKCWSQSVDVKVCNVAPTIREVLKTVRLDTLIDIREDEAAALAAYTARPAAGDSSKDSQAAETLQRQAERGDAAAQYELANCHDEGRGVSQDFAEALAWYVKAAEQGHADAQYALGMSYAFGLRVPQDYDKALAWYQKAAEQGHADAQYVMGMSFSYGLGVPQDPAAAANWYRRAAEIGDADAQAHLAVSYLEGSGVPQDKAEALRWFRDAAEQGHADAQLNLAWFYLNGEGVPEDRTEAIKWYRVAAQQGNKQAQEALDQLEAD